MSEVKPLYLFLSQENMDSLVADSCSNLLGSIHKWIWLLVSETLRVTCAFALEVVSDLPDFILICSKDPKLDLMSYC